MCIGEISVSAQRTATTRREDLSLPHLSWSALPLSDNRRAHSVEVSFKANPAVKLDPPSPPQDDVLINGLSTYVAFVPARKIGALLWANKRYPIDARATPAHEILTQPADQAPTN